jgi:hypothetical protein
VAVNFDDCRVDHGELHVRIIRHGIEYPFESTSLRPIAIPPEHRIPLAKRRRQISPWAARAGDPQNCFEKQAIVATYAAGIGRLAQTKRLDLRPLLVR